MTGDDAYISLKSYVASIKHMDNGLGQLKDVRVIFIVTDDPKKYCKFAAGG